MFERFKTQPKKEVPPEKKEVQKEDIRFPNAEAAIEAYLKQYPGEGKHAETIRTVFREFLDQELKNTRIFKSEQSGVEFPYTSIKIGELARAVYNEISGTELPQSGEETLIYAKQQFVFGTSIKVAEGDQFSFVEVAMHECVKHLITSLKNIQEGKPIQNKEIFTVGMPTNTLGKIPSEFAEKMGKNPADEAGKVYAEFVTSEMKNGHEPPKTIELYGISLGGNFAVRTGENLMENGLATQEMGTESIKQLPFLQIRVEAPVSLGPSMLKPLQIPLGFLTDAIMEAQRSDVKRIEAGKPGFAKNVKTYLAVRGIREQMSNEQKLAKDKVMRNIILSLVKSLRPKPGTKVTEVYGLNDLTTITPSLARDAALHRRGFPGKLGGNIIKRKYENERRFGARIVHLNPWFRKSELKRLDALGRMLETLRRSDRSVQTNA